MDSVRNPDRITAWLRQYVDPAFGPLLERLAKSGTPVQWEQGDFARTIRMQVGAGEITYTITIDPDSHPITGQLRFKSPQTECCKPFAPALGGRPKSPGEMAGPDLVNDLIDQYGQRLRHVLRLDRPSEG